MAERCDRPTVFLLHYLAGSARAWAGVVARLAGLRCVAIDLPGFGDAAQATGYAVADMADMVAQTVRAEAPRHWVLVGHSMGAKVAAVLARRAEDGAAGLGGLAGLLLLAGSPPGPEPMDERQRQMMTTWFAGDPDARRAQARHYIDTNVGGTLDAATAEQGLADVLRASRAAWLAWLERGSREDWSDRVGVLQTPALVVAGSDDSALGPQAQHSLVSPHFAHLRSVTLAGARHLLPMERPDDVARLIEEHAASVETACRRAQALGDSYRSMIDSDRVSSGTRKALLARAQPDDADYRPAALDTATMAILRAVLNRVVPKVGEARIDLAARIDTHLCAGVGDGWRRVDLPPDAVACRAGLLTLNDAALLRHGLEFIRLDGSRQDDMLRAIADAGPGTAAAPDRLDAGQMRSWFDDLRADAIRLYVAHPGTLARMGYSGIANGGDGAPKSGFVRVGAGEREAWEPLAATGFMP